MLKDRDRLVREEVAKIQSALNAWAKASGLLDAEEKIACIPWILPLPSDAVKEAEDPAELLNLTFQDFFTRERLEAAGGLQKHCFRIRHFLINGFYRYYDRPYDGKSQYRIGDMVAIGKRALADPVGRFHVSKKSMKVIEQVLGYYGIILPD